MKRWGLPFGILLIALGGAFYYEQQQASGRAGFPAPDFTLTGIDGRPYRLADFRGKIVFLNLWATWCPPCREEMPSMETLHQRLRGRDFVMLAVSEDEAGVVAVRPFVDQARITFPVLIDQAGLLSQRYGATGYPETFIIDRDGRVIQHIIGPEDWDSERAYQYFTRLIDQPVETTQVAGQDAPPGS